MMVNTQGEMPQAGPAISVITATYNAEDTIHSLIESLKAQSDSDFEWVVADGNSSDSTCQLVKDVNDIDVVLTSEADFGIYDALNRAILNSKAPFYVVVGADDQLYPDAIENFRKNLSSDTEIVAANILVNGAVRKPARGKSWLFGQYEFVAGHAVGTLFKKELHNTYGMYSHHFPIAADQLFIKRCCQGESHIVKADFIAGHFGLHGVSAQDAIGTLSESFRVQLMTEKYKSVQVVLYIARLLKNYFRL